MAQLVPPVECNRAASQDDMPPVEPSCRESTRDGRISEAWFSRLSSFPGPLPFSAVVGALRVRFARHGVGNSTNHACKSVWWARRSSVGRTCCCFGWAGASSSALVYPDCEAATGPLKLAIPMEHRRVLGCHSALSRDARPDGNPGTGAIACASVVD